MTAIDWEEYNALREKYKLDEGSVDDVEDMLEVVKKKLEVGTLVTLACPFRTFQHLCDKELAEFDPDEDGVELMKLSVASHMLTSHFKK